jgi:hypothetical protein
VIAVAVRDENELGCDFFRVDLLGEWIWGDEWIERSVFPPASTAKQACRNK